MNDNDIIKALKCCINEDSCVNCPFKSKEDDGCRYSEADIYVIILDYIEHLNKVIARLKKCNTFRRNYMGYFPKLERDKAIKEFAERLKEEKYPYTNNEISEFAVSVEDIDNLVKEMTGDQT